MSFDPNAAAAPDSGIFGLETNYKQSALILLPVPWEATTSYGGGTAQGPKAILHASHQVDLFDLEAGRSYEAGIFLLDESKEVHKWNKEAKLLVKKNQKTRRVNALSSQLNSYVKTKTLKIIGDGKIPALIGGDHSTPFGAIEAVAQSHPSFGILHFDAHSDTRVAYQGYTHSHASIMYNVLENIPQVKKLVQVGIRDFCEEEYNYVHSLKNRVSVFFDADYQKQMFTGTPWAHITKEIIAQLPDQIWISFDIDGLDPRFCPHTGTPVPGGLDFQQAVYVIAQVARSGKKIIGFDLNEVAPSSEKSDEWDANVGARLLYKLCAWTLVSQKKIKTRD